MVVTPGATLEVDCIYSKKRGTPEWRWANISKEYHTGWAIEENKKNWNYRLVLPQVEIEVQSSE